MNTIERIEKYIESLTIGPITWLFAFTGLMMVRFFLEALSSPSTSGIIASDLPTLLQYYLWFLALAIVLILFISYALPKWKKVAPGIILFGLTITWLPPIIDFIFSHGHGSKMTYLFQNGPQLIISFFTFFGNPIHGITIGIHVEVALVLIFFGYIFYITRKNILKTFGVVVALYAIIFVFVALPSFMYIAPTHLGGPLQPIKTVILNSTTLSNNLNGNQHFSSFIGVLETGFDFFMARILLYITLIGSLVLFYRTKKELLLSIFKNSRPERVLHYWIMMGFGIFLAWNISPWVTFSWNDGVVLITLMVAIYSAWMYSVCTNDLHDRAIDAISNPHRPLPSGSVTEIELKNISVLFLVTALISAYLAGYYAFFGIIAFISLYYVYSIPPLRLKRIPLFSSFIISLACLTIAISGFFTFSVTKQLDQFPIQAIIGLIVVTFLWAHVRDLKDVEGDRSAHIATLPVLCGPTWGPRVVGMSAASAFIVASLFIHTIFIYSISVAGALLTYYVVTRKPYREYPLFIIYFVWVIIAFLVL